MGKYLKPLFFVVILLSVSFRCFAASDNLEDFVANAPSEFSDASEDDISELVSTESLFDRVVDVFSDGFRSAFKLALTLCGVVMLVSLLKGIQTDNGILKASMTSAVSVAVTALCFSSIEQSLEAIARSVDSATVFCSSAVPVILALCISSGNSFSGAVFSTSVSFISTLLERISQNVLLPLVIIYLSFAIMSNVTQSANILSLDKQIKKFIKWVIGSFVTLFSISMSLQSFLSASSDSVLKRSVKSAVGTFVPVVGSTLSSSIESLFTIASNSKTAFSVLGIVIIIAIFLPSVAICTCYGLSLSLAKTFALFLNEDKTANVIGSVADTFYLLSAVCATCVIMVILSFLLICINLG